MSDPIVVSIQSSEVDQNAAKRDEENRTQESVQNWLLVTFNGLLVACTVFQIRLLLLYRREDLAHRQEDTEDYRNEHRAWVSFEVEIPTELSADQPFFYKLYLFNHGRTVAREVGFRSSQWLIDRPTTPGTYEIRTVQGDWNESRGAIFPTAKSGNVAGIPVNTGYIPDEHASICMKLKSVELVLAVEVKYLDAYDRSHVTTQHYAIGGNGDDRYTILIPGSSTIT